MIVVTTILGISITWATSPDFESWQAKGTINSTLIVHTFWGGAIGAVVGSLLWGLLGYTLCRNKNAAELPPSQPSIMSPTEKTLIVVFGGLIVMVVTTICGVAIMVAISPMEKGGLAMLGYLYIYAVGGAIGAVVGVPIWVRLGYKVCRDKNAAIDGCTT